MSDGQNYTVSMCGLLQQSAANVPVTLKRPWFDRLEPKTLDVVSD